MVAFQVNKQWQRVCVCVCECARLSSVDRSRVYICLSVWPFHSLPAIKLSMQTHTQASQCLFMLKGCRDVHCCLCAAFVIRSGRR